MKNRTKISALLPVLGLLSLVGQGQHAFAQSGTWKRLPSGSIPRRNEATATLDGILYAAGGALANSTSSSGALEAFDPRSATWSTKAALLVPSQGAAAAGLNGLLYVAGGGNCCNAFGTLQAYDPARNSWSMKSSMPYNAYYPAAAVANGLLYVTGGTSGHGVIYGTLAAYNPGTGRWLLRAPMPTPRAGLGIAAVDGILYAIGGGDVTGPLGVVEAYDPASNRWSKRKPMPTLVASFTVSSASGVVYVIADNGLMQVYNPSTDSWTTGVPMPQPLDAPKSTVIDDQVYVTGNLPPSYPNSSVLMLQSFAPAPGPGWSLLPSARVPRRNVADAALDGILYAAGGALPNSTGSSDALEAFDPAANVWTTKRPMPIASQGAAAAGMNGFLYVVGGGGCCGGFSDLQEYDPVNNLWSRKSQMPYAAYYPAAAAVDGVLYVTGGTSGYGTIFRLLAAYDSATDSWSIKPSLPTARAGLGMVEVRGILYAIGGGNQDGPLGIVEAFDIANETWSTRAPMPKIVSSFTVAALHNLIYVISDAGLVQIYNPATDAWTTGLSLTQPLDAPKSAVIDGEIYLTGNRPPGYPDSSPLLLEVFTPAPLKISIDYYAGLTISGETGQAAQVEYKTNVDDPEWTYLSSFILPSPDYLFIDTSSTVKTKRFYRTVLLP